MKILYVDLFYDYGIKSRGLNLIGQDGFKKSLEGLGHQVVPFYYDDLLHDKVTLQVDVLKAAAEAKPDLVFFCLFKEQFEHETLQKLKQLYTTINWFGDDQWRFNTFTKLYANDFTYCITTNQFSLLAYKAIGQNNVILSQWAAIDSYGENESLTEYKHDVSFVGGYHPYRAWFINQLNKQGISVNVFGFGWPNGALSAEEMNQLFLESKINLNISNSNSFDLRYLISSPKALLRAIISRKSSSQIKACNFEIPFFGGFQLTDYVPSLENYFNIGKDVACYSTPEDAALQIKYYLSNNEQRIKICNSGHKKSVAEHGYLNRFRLILEQVE